MDAKQLIKLGFDKEQVLLQDQISDKLEKILRDNWMAYLAMEMRTGKTITAFLTCKKLGFKKVFMVSKKKALSSLVKDAQLFEKDFRFVCMNFEQLHHADEVRFGTEDFFNPDVFIIDEAHSLGQYPKPAERTKLLVELCQDMPIIYLSGTPTPESYSQIFHQFFICSYSPFKEYKSFYRWADDYVQVRERYLGQIRIKDYSGALEFKIKPEIDHLFISLTQKEAGFKQEVMEKIITVPMQDSTWFLFDTLMSDRVYEGNDDSVILAETEVKLQAKLHQISSGTVIVTGKGSDGEDAKVFDFSKAQYIKEHYKGKKIAVYYKFIAEKMALVGTFGYDIFTDDPMEFNRTGPEKIFWSQVSSGREGVDLSSADVIICYNIDFSAVSYFQIRSRMQTKNRKKSADLHWLFSDKGIEKKIYESVVNKKDYTLSYFKKDYDITSVVRTFKSSTGSIVRIHAPTDSEAMFKERIFKLIENGDEEQVNELFDIADNTRSFKTKNHVKQIKKNDDVKGNSKIPGGHGKSKGSKKNPTKGNSKGTTTPVNKRSKPKKR